MGCSLKPCYFCTAEVGVYIFSLVHLLFVTGAVVLGVAQSFTTYSYMQLSDDVMPFSEKALHVGFLVGYILYVLMELVFREYLYVSLDMGREKKLCRCQIWVKAKLVLIFFLGFPVIGLHLYLELTPFKLIMYSLAASYGIYYVWVVRHFALEIEREVAELKATNNDKDSTASTNTNGKIETLHGHSFKV